MSNEKSDWHEVIPENSGTSCAAADLTMADKNFKSSAIGTRRTRMSAHVHLDDCDEALRCPYWSTFA